MVNGEDVFGVMCAMVAGIVNKVLSVIWCALVCFGVWYDGRMVTRCVV